MPSILWGAPLLDFLPPVHLSEHSAFPNCFIVYFLLFTFSYFGFRRSQTATGSDVYSDLFLHAALIIWKTIPSIPNSQVQFELPSFLFSAASVTLPSDKLRHFA